MDTTLQHTNNLQIQEAIGEVNRYYFFITHNREPYDLNELILFYIENGGATGFRERYEKGAL
jgi:hypothetical protein